MRFRIHNEISESGGAVTFKLIKLDSSRNMGVLFKVPGVRLVSLIMVSIMLLISGSGVTAIGAGSAPDEEWDKRFGRKLADRGAFVQQTRDGGYIVTGSTASFYMHGRGDSDVYLLKVDATGTKEWDKTYGGAGYEEGRCVQQTSDEGYIMVGTTRSFSSQRHNQVFLVRTDAAGQRQWQKTLGDDGEYTGMFVQEIRDGGFIIVGSYDKFGDGRTSLYLARTRPNGAVVWEKTVGGQGIQRGSCVRPTSDGGFIVVGATSSRGGGGLDVYLVKTDGDGRVEWEKTFGGQGDDEGFSLHETGDGGWIIAGQTFSSGHRSSDVYLLKVDEMGNLEWEKAIGGAGWEVGYSVWPAVDGGYVVVGVKNSPGADYDIYVVKTDASGQLLWEKTLGEKGCDEAYCIQQTDDGGYIVVGWTNSFGPNRIWDYQKKYDYDDVYLIKLKPEGESSG